ncbi:MAG: DNA polymerase [Candidatus Daviesbacteria bacterium]|nr:DNA polymerase [Candidatus Daviesbacteria bacterium]
MEKIVLVDGNALLHRAYHATPPLSTSKGELINAVFGFTSMLLKALDELKPEYIAVTWDLKAKTFRHEVFEQYKAKRKPMDEGLASQFDRAHQIIEAFNIPQFSLIGYEADDLIGTLATQAVKLETRNSKLETIIVTGDRDLMQLISERVKIFMPKKTLADVGLYGEEEFALKYGFAPKNLVDFKALAGDQSDGIPGVPKIGEVSATKLIQEYQTIENIYKNLDKVPERTRKLLEEGRESAFLSHKLATINTNTPIKLDLPACKVHDFEREKVVELFNELQFKSLISRIPNIPSVIPARFAIASARRAKAGIQKAWIPDPFGLAQGGQVRDDNSEIASPALSDRNDNNMTDSDKNQNQATTDLDKEVVPILEEMSKIGVLVDLVFLSRLSEDLHSRLDKIEQEIYSIIGHQCNLNSPKQLQIVLFDELNLPVVKKTKTGRSTDEETLLELKTAHPVVSLLLQYRTLYKLVSTYVDALPKSVGDDGRVHSTFNVEGASTGRITSNQPNLQNIPVKGEMGSEIRKAFIAPKGSTKGRSPSGRKVLLGADYSQIELRILADLSQDENLIKAFKENQDIHTLTAAKIFEVPLDKVTKEQRNVGKTMNFATLYGQGPHALSRQLGVEYNTAKQYIDEYFEQFPKIKIWKEKVLKGAYETGYAETLWGRKRYIPELKAGNKMMQSFGERAAINHPVQGCLPWETKILTSSGYIPIGELYSAKDKPSLVWDGSDWWFYEVLDRGEAQLAQIKFSNGQVFKCDIRHKVLTVDENGYEWKEFSQLRSGMKVCFSMPTVHEFSSTQFRFKHTSNAHNGISLNIIADKELWYWLGYYIGDGYLHKRWNRAWAFSLTYFFGEHESEKRDNCIKFFTSLGLHPTQRKTTHRPKVKLSTRYLVTVYSQGFGRLFEEIGLLGGKNAHTKRLPSRIFKESLENRCVFIKGIMDSDGYDGIKENNNPSIHICQRGLLQEIQLLLKTVGTESQIRGPYLYNEKISYRLDIHRNALARALRQGEMSRFDRYLNRLTPQFLVQEAVSLGGHLQKTQFATASDYVLYSRWKNGGSSSLYYFQTWLKRNNVILQSPVYHFNEITEIDILDQFETTYTLSVPGSHRFDSEGVISKNTAADMIKKAMVEINNQLSVLSGQSSVFGQSVVGLSVTGKRKTGKLNSENRKQKTDNCKLILQVHDELLFECNENSAEELGKMVKEKMENALKLSVPVIVDLKTGPNWGEMKSLKI